MGRIEINAFGPVRVRVDGDVVELPPRCVGVLVRLLLARGRPVDVDEIHRSVWSGNGRVGRDERIAVQKAITELRRRLDPERPGPDSEVLTTDRGSVSSYRLILDAESVDIYRFEDQVLAGSSPEDWKLVISLWTDRPLRGVADRPFTREAVDHLINVRTRACAELLRAFGRAGRAGEGLAVLDRLVAAQPDDAELRATVERLRSESPVEADTQAVAGRTGDDRPAELPPQAHGFTGRERELAALDDMLSPTDGVAIAVLAGPGGVGKTALALRWAHRAAGRFPDGQIYVDLRGFDTEEPLRPDDVLARFLVTLGARGSGVPYDLAAKAARYRSLLTGRRMLIVLDNAADPEQVRPLLPGTSTCCVVVTSRDSLAGLVARDGARRLDVDVLTLDEATKLLRRLLDHRADDSRNDEHGDALTVVAQRCGGLPLALRIVAERQTHRPELSLASLLQELDHERGRLDALQADERTAVRTVFSWSLRHLDDRSARLFRLLGLNPGLDIDPHAAAALADTTVADAVQVIGVLRRSSLVRSSRPHRVDMHDLVRAYAGELAVTDDDEAQRTAAVTRLLDFYLCATSTAMDVFLPAKTGPRPIVAVPRHALPAFAEPADGLAWLRAELPNLQALSAHAAQHGWPSFATDLASTLSDLLLWHNNDLQLAWSMHENALLAARVMGDRVAEAAAEVSLGRICSQWDRASDAIDYFLRALPVVRTSGDRHAVGSLVSSIGATYLGSGKHSEAVEHFREALVIMREFDNRVGEAINTHLLASADRLLGRYESALASYRRVVELGEETGDLTTTAWALADIAALLSRRGDNDTALEYAQRALVLARQVEFVHEASVITVVGVILGRLGRLDEAVAHHDQALRLNRRDGSLRGEIEALNGLGLVEVARGHPLAAVTYHRQALDIAREVGDRLDQALTLNHLGEALHAAGEDAEAVRHHREAGELARVANDRFEQARAAQGLGLALAGLGESTEAQPALAEARALFAELGRPGDEA